MQFRIDAIEGQRPVRLLLDAGDAADARLQAERRGLSVVAVRGGAAAWGGGWSSGRAAFPLLHFNHSLLLLLRSGLSIVEAVETLAERESGAAARRVLQQLHAQLSQGLPMSAALAAQPRVFPPLLVASVRANETTGALVEAIERFNAYQSRSELLKKRLASAALYPALVLAVGALVVGFLLLYVVPRFAVVFEDMGDRIPAAAQLLLQWGRFMHAHGGGVLAAGAAVLVLAAWAVAQPGFRAALGRAVQRLPRVGRTLHTFALSRFYRALGLLVQAGTPVLPALDLARDLLPAALQSPLAAARQAVAEGRALSDAFERHGLSTPIARRLLRVAERSGAMGEMLERTATFHDEDIAQEIEWAVRLAEPLLMVGIGLVIGCVVLLMYAPIFELAGSLQ